MRQVLKVEMGISWDGCRRLHGDIIHGGFRHRSMGQQGPLLTLLMQAGGTHVDAVGRSYHDQSPITHCNQEAPASCYPQTAPLC